MTGLINLWPFLENNDVQKLINLRPVSTPTWRHCANYLYILDIYRSHATVTEGLSITKVTLVLRKYMIFMFIVLSVSVKAFHVLMMGRYHQSVTARLGPSIGWPPLPQQSTHTHTHTFTGKYKTQGRNPTHLSAGVWRCSLNGFRVLPLWLFKWILNWLDFIFSYNAQLWCVP